MNSLSEINGPIPAPSAGLAAGTLVTTPDGDKKIEDVKAGDWVLGGVGEGISQFHKVAEAKSSQYSGLILTSVAGFRVRS